MQDMVAFGKNKKLIDIISNIDNIYDLEKIGSAPYKLEVV